MLQLRYSGLASAHGTSSSVAVATAIGPRSCFKRCKQKNVDDQRVRLFIATPTAGPCECNVYSTSGGTSPAAQPNTFARTSKPASSVSARSWAALSLCRGMLRRKYFTTCTMPLSNAENSLVFSILLTRL